MKKVKAIIVGGREQYGVWIEGAHIYSAGDTLEELKEQLQEAIALYLEAGGEVSDEMKGEYEIEYVFHTSGLLKYYSQYISFAGMKQLTGINQKQLWDYAYGYRNPKKSTTDKIVNALQAFGKELSQIRVCF